MHPISNLIDAKWALVPGEYGKSVAICLWLVQIFLLYWEIHSISFLNYASFLYLISFSCFIFRPPNQWPTVPLCVRYIRTLCVTDNALTLIQRLCRYRFCWLLLMCCWILIIEETIFQAANFPSRSNCALLRKILFAVFRSLGYWMHLCRYVRPTCVLADHYISAIEDHNSRSHRPHLWKKISEF